VTVTIDKHPDEPLRLYLTSLWTLSSYRLASDTINSAATCS